MTSEEFWGILHAMPLPKPISYRLYHDSKGKPICYTMEDLAGEYIEVDAETYQRQSPDVKVEQGQLVVLPIGHKLKPSNVGTPCDPRDVCVVVTTEQDHVYWRRS
jgi:hypothetical protein